jgi:hypothetical protein
LERITRRTANVYPFRVWPIRRADKGVFAIWTWPVTQQYRPVGHEENYRQGAGDGADSTHGGVPRLRAPPAQSRSVTALEYRYRISRLEGFVGKPAEDITPQDVRAWLRAPGYSAKTKSETLASFCAFHRWGNLEHLWPLNAIAFLQGPKTVRNPLAALDVEDARVLLDACRTPRQYSVVYLGLYAGLRISESASVSDEQWRRVDKLRVLGKGSKVLEIPVHDQLLARRDVTLARGTRQRQRLQNAVVGLRKRTGPPSLLRLGAGLPLGGLRGVTSFQERRFGVDVRLRTSGCSAPYKRRVSATRRAVGPGHSRPPTQRPWQFFQLPSGIRVLVQLRGRGYSSRPARRR